MTLLQKEIKRVTMRPLVPGTDYLCFTANSASSTVQLAKTGSPTVVTLETSTDGTNWSTYTFGSTITLNNIGDKVYFRNTSETTTGFSTSTSNYYGFSMTGSISASGDVTTLLNKNGTDTIISSYCFYRLFYACSSLITCPRIPATTVVSNCYTWMFANCSNLEAIPELPATVLAATCYDSMFILCSKIKLSTTQDSTYANSYRIPSEGTGTTGSSSLRYMFNSTGGTFTGTPTINTTYYTSNTVIDSTTPSSTAPKTQVEKQIRPVIPFTPGANTLLYLPLNSTDTYTDKSGHITYSNYGVTFGTYQGVDCGIFNGNSYLNGTNITFGSNTTILGWYYFDGSGLTNQFFGFLEMRVSGSNVYFMGYSKNSFGYGYFNWNFDDIKVNNYTYDNQWIFYAITLGGGSHKWYIKGNNINELQTYSKTNNGFTSTKNQIGKHDSYCWKGGMSEIIIENRTWTDQEISDYYNQTKGNYGI